MNMKKTALIAIMLSLLLCGCSLVPLSPEKAAEKAAAQMTAGDLAAAAGDFTAALEKYRAAEALTPADMATLRAQIEVLTQLAAQSEEYESQLITAWESLYAADAFEEADYTSLAELYIAAGSFRQARDIMEISQCLNPTEEKAALLDSITVDTSTDGETVQNTVPPLLDKLRTGDRDGAVDYILSDALSQLCSRVPGGSRRYTAADGDAQLKLLASSVGGQFRADMWYTAADGSVTVISHSPAALFIGTSSLKDGAYDGAFTAQYYKASNGSIVEDSGSFTNGLATGSISTEVYSGGEATTLSELWSARAELERTAYTGELDEGGHATAKAASGLESGQIAYAYAEGNTQYVYVIGSEEDTAETFAFTPASFGFEALPQW